MNQGSQAAPSQKNLLELKGRLADLQPARAWAEGHATRIAEVHQVDTYFRVRSGRLKLRKVEGEEGATLIYYAREDLSGPKHSQVRLLPLASGDTVRELLVEALGVLVTVRKRRSIYRWGRVQIHLDVVEGLGTFVEFERVLESIAEESVAQEEFAQLRGALGIEEDDLVAGSYSDLLLERG